MKLLRLAPLIALVAVAACSGAPTSPPVAADTPASFDLGPNTIGSGNIDDDSGGFGSGNSDASNSAGDGTVSFEPNTIGSGNRNEVGVGFGAGYHSTSSAGGPAPVDSASSESRGVNMVGSGN